MPQLTNKFYILEKRYRDRSGYGDDVTRKDRKIRGLTNAITFRDELGSGASYAATASMMDNLHMG